MEKRNRIDNKPHPNALCLLGYFPGEIDGCSSCKDCGWYPTEAERRRQLLNTCGLSKDKTGRKRFIIRAGSD